MADLIEIASRVMMTAERRLEQTANNVANLSTSGYRSGAVFSEIIAGSGGMGASGGMGNAQYNLNNWSFGGLVSTGSPLDLAIAGDGYFRVRTESGEGYTRAGRFLLSADGRVTTEQGYVLQDASGGDLVLQSGVPDILSDGTVLEDGLPAGRIAAYRFEGGAPLAVGGGVLFAAPEGAVPVLSDAAIRQGVYEGSNVSMPAEMIEMMRAVKQAESGARLAQAYDGLLGQAITTFGQRK